MPEDPKIGDFEGFLEFIQTQGGSSSDSGDTSRPLIAGEFISSGSLSAPEGYDRGWRPGLDINDVRYANQSAWDATGNALARTASATFYETLEGLGYIGTGAYEIMDELWDKDDNNYLEMQNKLSTWAREAHEQNKRQNPVFTKGDQEYFSFTNPMSWAANAESIGTMAALFIPGMAAGKASGLVGRFAFKGLKKAAVQAAAKGGTLAANAGRVRGAISTLNKLGPYVEAGAATVGSTLASRPVENLMEGYGVFYETMMTGLIEKGMDENQSEAIIRALSRKGTEALNDPEYGTLFAKAASNAAEATTANWMSATTDLLQWGIIHSGLGKVFKASTSISPQAGRLAKLGNLGKKAWNVSGALAIEAGTEGLEEGLQYVISQEALLDSPMWGAGFGDRLEQYMANEEFWSSVKLGAVLGGGMHGLGVVANKVAGRVKDRAEQWAHANAIRNYTAMAFQKDNWTATMANRAFQEKGTLEYLIDETKRQRDAIADSDNAESQNLEQYDFLLDLYRTLEDSEVPVYRNSGYTNREIGLALEKEVLMQSRKFTEGQLNERIDQLLEQAEKTKYIDGETVTREQVQDAAELRAIEEYLSQNSKALRKLPNHLDGTYSVLLGRQKALKEKKGPKVKLPQMAELVEIEKALIENNFVYADMKEAVSKLSTRAGVLEAIASRDRAMRNAAKEVAKDEAAKVTKKTTPEDVRRMREEELATTGGTDHIDEAVDSNVTPISDLGEKVDVNKMSPEEEKAKRAEYTRTLNEAYDDSPIAMDKHARAISRIVGKDLSGSKEEFINKVVNHLMMPQYHDAIMDVLHGELNQHLEDTPTVGSTKRDIPTESNSDPDYDSLDELLSELAQDASLPGQINVLNPQWKMVPGTGQFDRNPDGTLIPNPMTDGHAINFGRLNDPTFKLVDKDFNAKVSFIIDPNDPFTQRRSAQDDIAGQMSVQIIATAQDGSEHLIGFLPTSTDKNHGESAKLYRKYIWESLGETMPSEIQRVNAEVFVDEEYAGRFNNELEAKFTVDEVFEGKNLVFLTALPTDDGKVIEVAGWKGKKNIPKEIIDQINKIRTNSSSEIDPLKIMKPGFIYAMVQMSNGRYVPYRLQTHKAGEVEEVAKDIEETVDELFNPEMGVSDKQQLLDDLSQRVHINHATSHYKVYPKGEQIVITLNRKDKGLPTKKETPSAQELKDFLKEQIVFISTDELNVDNSKLTKYLRKTNLNPQQHSHSISYRIRMKDAKKPDFSQPVSIEKGAPATKIDFEEPPTDLADMGHPVTDISNLMGEAPKGNPAEQKQADFARDIPAENPLLKKIKDPRTKNKKSKPKASSVKLSEPMLENYQQEIKDIMSVLGDEVAQNIITANNLFNILDTKPAKEYMPGLAQIIYNVKASGEMLEGLFTDAGIYLQKTGTKGRGYHEAFHAVFNLALDLNQRTALLNEIRKNLNNEALTATEAEEILAEKFRAFMISPTKPSLTDRIRDAFIELFLAIKEIFAPGSTLNSNRLFKQMRDGRFRGKVQFAMPMGSISTVRAFSPHVHSRSEVASYRTVFRHFFNEMMNENRGLAAYEGLDDLQILQTESKDFPSKKADNKVVEYIKDEVVRRMFIHAQENSETEEELGRYWEMMQRFFGAENLDFKYAPDGSIDRVYLTGNNNFVVQSLMSLVDYGIKINAYRDTVVETEFDDSDDTTTDDVDIADTQDSDPEAWAVKAQEVDNRSTLRGGIRRVLHSLPLLDAEGNQVVDPFFGVPLQEDGTQVMSILEDTITDSIDENHMMERLANLMETYPWVRTLTTMLKKDPTLRSQLYIGLGGQTYISYVELGRNERPFIANSKKTKNIVQRDIIANVMNPRNPLFKSGFEIDTVNARKFKSAVEMLGKRLQQNGAQLMARRYDTQVQLGSNTITLNELIKKLEKVLIDHGFIINEYALKNIFATSGGLEKLLLGDSSISVIAQRLEDGTNMFLDVEDNLASQQFLLRLAEVMQIGYPNRRQPSYYNAARKLIYSITTPSYLSEQLALLKHFPEKFFDNHSVGSLKDSPWLQDLQFASDATTQLDKLEMTIFGGATFNNRGVPYAKMNRHQLELSWMNMWKNASAKGYAYLPGPIPADSNQLPLFQVKKFSGKISQDAEGNMVYDNKPLADKLFQVAIMEQGRITRWKNSAKNIRNTEVRGGEFHYFPFLKDGEVRVENKEEISERIMEYIRKEGKDFVERMVDAGYTPREATDFFFNSYYYNTQFIEVFQGNPAYYKSTGDAMKRFKQYVSPGSSSGIPAQKMTMVVLPDEKMRNDSTPARAKQWEKLQDMIANDPYTRSLWNKPNNLTDGFTFFRAQDYLTFIIERAKIDPSKREAYNEYLRRLENWDISKPWVSNLTPEEERDLFNPIKPFMYTKLNQDGEQVPVQLKTSFHVLVPEIVERGDENLKKVWTLMKKGVNLVAFDSAQKVGIKETPLLKGKLSLDELVEIDLSSEEMEEIHLQTFYSNGVRWQQDTPAHWANDTINWGSQIRALIMAGLQPGESYTLGDGTKLSTEEIKELFFDTVTALLETDSKHVAQRWMANNYANLSTDMINSAYKMDFIESDVQLIQQMLNDKDPSLFNLLALDFVENMVSSLVRNNVFKMKMPGGQFVNASSYGLAEELKLINKNGHIQMEAYLPAWSKALLEVATDTDGNIDMSKVDERVLNLVGYRVPTEDKYSMFSIKVKGFLPQSQGGTIILPAEITKIAGLDFDIDKLFIMAPNHYKTANVEEQLVEEYGIDLYNASLVESASSPQIEALRMKRAELEKQSGKNYVAYNEYTTNEGVPSHKKSRQNLLIDIMKTVLEHPSNSANVLGPGNFSRLETLGFAMAISRLPQYSKLSFQELMSIDYDTMESIIQEYEKVNHPIASPATQTTFFERIRTGAGLIGIFANHRVHLAKAEETMLATSQYIHLNGESEGRSMLNRAMDENENMAANLAMVVAAMVDNVKNPIAPYINLNTDTADVFALLLRLGYPMEFAVALLSHNSIGSVIREAQETQKSFKYVLDKKVQEALNEGIVVKDASYNLTIDDIHGVNTKEINAQVLKTFSDLMRPAGELSRLITASKPDASAPASRAADVKLMRDMRAEFMDPTRKGALSGVDGFFDGSNKLTKAYLDNVVSLVETMYSDLLPYFGEELTVYDQMTTTIVDMQPAAEHLTKEQHRKILRHATSFLMSHNPGLQNSFKERGIIIKEALELLQKARTKPNGQYDLLVSLLRPESKAAFRSNVIDRIHLDRQGLTAETKQAAREQWYEMINSSDPEVAKLGMRLFQYVLVNFQNVANPFAFTELMHPKMLDIKLEGESINDTFKKISSKYHYDTMNFLDQFVRNTFWEAGSTVPSTEIKPKAGTNTIFLPNSEVNRLKTSKKIMPPYIRYYDDSRKAMKWRLYKLEKGNEYVEIEPLGVKDYLNEYDPNTSNLRSVIMSNRMDEQKKETAPTSNFDQYNRSVPDQAQEVTQGLDELSGTTEPVSLDDVAAQEWAQHGEKLQENHPGMTAEIWRQVVEEMDPDIRAQILRECYS